jgi:starch-binding outer membrane protein, SusD/RagB family
VGQEKWADCLAQCNDIIGQYSLDPTYRNIFKTDNETSPEIIFAIPFDENRGGGFFAQMFSWHGALKAKSNMQATPWGFGSAMAIPQFIDTYDPADERLADTWLMGQQYAMDGSPIQTSGKPFVLTNLSNEFPFFRYAEVLMMKAECLLRTGNSAEAAQLVSSVRAQHGFRQNPAKATVTGLELEQNTRYQYGFVENYKVVDPGNTTPVAFGRFLDELGWEFAWEGHRRRDMIRFGTFTTKSWLSHKPQGDYRDVFPLPEIQIGANPKIEQNPAYQ